MLALATLALSAPERSSAETALVADDSIGFKLAHSGYVVRAFTCKVNSIADECPGVEELRDHESDMQIALTPPANKRWLFYGPSYMKQMFEAIVAANEHHIRAVMTLDKYLLEEHDVTFDYPPASDADGCGNEEPFVHNVSLVAGGSVALCNVATEGSSGECKMDTREDHVVTLNSGAVLFFYANQNVNDLELKNLNTLLRTVSMDRIFFMMPHSAAYFQEHCNATREGRAAKRENMNVGDGDMCFKNEEDLTGPIASPTTPKMYKSCAVKSRIWQAIHWHTAQNNRTKMMTVMPHAVSAHGLGSSHAVYYQSPAAKKYACATGGSTPGQKGFGQGFGPCTDVDSNAFFKLGHPCLVVCDGARCVPGSAAQMAAEMVGLASDDARIRGPAESHEQRAYGEWRGVQPVGEGTNVSLMESHKYPGYTKAMENASFPCGEAQ